MDKNKGSIGLNLIFIIFILSLFGLLAFLYNNNLQLSKQISSMGDRVKPPVAETNTLITTGKYKISIPKSWTVVEGLTGMFEAPDKSTLTITVSESDKDSLVEYLKELDKIQEMAWEGKPVKNILSVKNTTVAGNPAIQREEAWLAAGLPKVLNTYTMFNRVVYSFYIVSGETPYEKTDIYSKYQEVLDSFVPVTETSTYTCPENGWVSCMPILSEEGKKACSPEAMAWYKVNCPGFKGAAL